MQLDLSLYFHAFIAQPASRAVLSILSVNSEAFRTKLSELSVGFSRANRNLFGEPWKRSAQALIMLKFGLEVRYGLAS